MMTKPVFAPFLSQRSRSRSSLGPFPRQSPLIRRSREGAGRGTVRARLVAWHLDRRRIGGRVAFVVMVARNMLSAEATDMTEKKCRCVASKAAGRLSRSDQEGDGGRRVRT